MGSAEMQGKIWSEAPEDWLENERFGIPFYEAVFSALGIQRGTRLLDIGCGAGLALTMARDRGAKVSGIDAAPGLLEVARRRLPETELLQGEIESLPYPDGSFDVVTSFNAVQFAADPVNALREAARVTAEGGRVALVTWGDPERCDIRFVLAAVAPLMPSPPPGAPGPFALSAPGKLEELAVAGGLRPEKGADVPAPFTFNDLDVALRIQLSAGPFRRAMAHSGEDVVRKAVADAFSAFRQPDGSYRLHNEFRYLIAEPVAHLADRGVD
ncbi:MAG TPA: class I SAM-dependent methyltransferase [Acidimicrobiales bacterium]|nr:class I SAM-dependent methyltransferase [Acidimicrobiales bacterium]